MEAFRDGLVDCDLMDLGFSGTPFTWSNQRTEPHTIRCRLDRFCGNRDWRGFAHAASVQHMSFPGSDHLPVLIRIIGQPQTGSRCKNRPWRFNAHWIRKEECQKVVKEGWESALDPDCFDRLFSGIDACQLGIRQWSRDIHNNPRRRIEELREKLHGLSLATQTEETKNEGAALRAELDKVYSDEDFFWRQSSKVQWARDGDMNTSYFHKVAFSRKENNTIHGLYNREGVWCEEDRAVEGIISDPFGELFQSSYPSEALMDGVLENVGARVTQEMNNQLALPFTSDEVHSALSHIAPLKSPGPDGLPAVFFQKYWHLLGSNITTCVLDFLNSHRMPQALNYTYVALIPKLARPKRIIEFRPISLCNVVYKICAKAFANRIKPCLNTTISNTQSAFVPGRLITDNVLVAYEVNHYIHCHSHGKRAYMALNLMLPRPTIE